MKKRFLHQPMEVSLQDLKDWKENTLVYHFFEIVHILEGHGERIVNENAYPYKKGDIYIFTPLDCRGFESQKPTVFCSIRFSEVFLTPKNDSHTSNQSLIRLKQLEEIFYHHNRFQSLSIRNADDCIMVKNLISNIIVEYKQKRLFSQQNIQHHITSILNILSRNIAPKPDSEKIGIEEPLINKLLTYIKLNISNRENLKTEKLSERFNISKTYIGEYFKKLTGENLQRYILVYKLKCAEQRLMYSDYSIKQISDELGFADTSHLSQQFKKHYGISPSRFKKVNQVELLKSPVYKSIYPLPAQHS